MQMSVNPAKMLPSLNKQTPAYMICNSFSSIFDTNFVCDFQTNSMFDGHFFVVEKKGVWVSFKTFFGIIKHIGISKEFKCDKNSLSSCQTFLVNKKPNTNVELIKNGNC